MKFGFVLPNNWGLPDPRSIIDLAVEAEQLGFDSVWVNHHVLNVGYIAERLEDRPYYDALTMLDWVAARTEHVKLGTSVLVLPYLHPMVVAKQMATLDRLSGGRVIAGLGVGSLPQENAAMGVGYDDRGAKSDEFIEVMKRLWAPGAASFDGDHYSFSDIVASPKPHHSLPIWIGGSGNPAQRRAARVGDAWHLMASVNGLGRRMPDFVEKLEAAGRSRDDIIIAPRIDVRQVPDAASVDEWRDAGADQLIVGTSSTEMSAVRGSLARLAATMTQSQG